MKRYFSLNRIRYEELLNDVMGFLVDMYKQSMDVFSTASPFGQIIQVIVRIVQMIFFYIEDSITELFINTATRPSSIRGLASLTGHQVTRAIASRGSVRLYYLGTGHDMYLRNNTVVINSNTKIKCLNNGLTYILVFPKGYIEYVIGSKPYIYCNIYQGYFERQVFTGTGDNFQTYTVYTKPSNWIDEYAVYVYVNGERFKVEKSILDLKFMEKSCIVRTSVTGTGIDIIFGNGITGYVPPEGSVIEVEYLVCNGLLGNLMETENISFEFMDKGYDLDGNEVDLNELFNIKSIGPISFGSDPEPIELTKLLTPNTSRNYVLANVDLYRSFFEKMQMFSYINVYTKYDKYDLALDNVVFALLIPDLRKRIRYGESYFDLPLKYFTLTNEEKNRLINLLYESGKMIMGSSIYFVKPRFRKYVMNVYIGVWKGEDILGLKGAIVNEISNYMLSFKRRDILPKSDIVALIENIPGVDYVDVQFISEDIEFLLYNLLNDNKEYLDKYGIVFEENSDKMKKMEIILSNDNVRNYIGNYITSTGNIVVNNEIVLIRGGWRDRFGNFYLDKIDYKHKCSLNIFIESETDRSYRLI